MSPNGYVVCVACLLEDWAPPQDWRQVEVTPEAVGVALGIVNRSFEKQSAWEAASYSLKKVYRGDPRNGSTRTRAANFCGFPEKGDGINAGGDSMRALAARCHWR